MGVGNHPFRLEKYVRLVKSADAPSEVSDLLLNGVDSGVVGIEEFKEWVSVSGTDLQDSNMSDCFSSARLGYRLVFTTSPSDRGNKEWGAASAKDLASSLGSFVSSMENGDELSLRERTLKVPVDTTAYDAQSWYYPDSDYMYMIPVASAEMDLDSESTVSEFSSSLNLAAEQNRSCLLDEVAGSSAYEAIFGIALPFKKMLSWLAIYTINNFMPSVGWAQDGWVKDGGKWMGFAGGFRSWDQQSFEKSKRAAKSAFMRFYHSNDPTYEDEEQKQSKKEITRQKKSKSSADPGFRWWFLRRRVRKPTDKNEELCL